MTPSDAVTLAHQLFSQSGGSAALQEFAYQPRNYVRGSSVFLAEYAGLVVDQALGQQRFGPGEAGRVHTRLVKVMRLFWELICESQRLARYTYMVD